MVVVMVLVCILCLRLFLVELFFDYILIIFMLLHEVEMF
jgi:hypothetical protein